MNMINREKFLKNCPETVGNILTGMERCGELAFSELPEGNTVLVIVDVINGFVREGAMACAEIGRIVNPIAELMKTFTAKGMAGGTLQKSADKHICCMRRLHGHMRSAVLSVDEGVVQHEQPHIKDNYSA